MKIAIVSDLHLDFHNVTDDFYKNEENAEILLIAGDTCESKYLNNFKNIFKKICKNYSEVYIIAGNHEFYKSFYHDALEQIEKFTKNISNLYFLNDNSIEIGNYLLIGCTLWTNFNNGNPLVLYNAKTATKDYNLIKIIKNGYRKLAPKDTLEFHINSKQFIETELKKNKDTILLTHHAPTFKSIFIDNPTMNDYSFASDLSNLILDNKQIKYWIHGHTHISCDYKIGNCRILSNQRGYPHDNSSSYYPLVIEI